MNKGYFKFTLPGGSLETNAINVGEFACVTGIVFPTAYTGFGTLTASLYLHAEFDDVFLPFSAFNSGQRVEITQPVEPGYCAVDPEVFRSIVGRIKWVQEDINAATHFGNLDFYVIIGENF